MTKIWLQEGETLALGEFTRPPKFLGPPSILDKWTGCVYVTLFIWESFSFRALTPQKIASIECVVLVWEAEEFGYLAGALSA